MKKHLQEQLVEDKQLIDFLLGDIQYCDKLLKEQDTAFFRRTHIRTIFSFIEAMAFVFRRHARYSIELDLQCKATNALKIKDENDTHLKKWIESRLLMHEWALLSPEEYSPDSTGRLQKKEAKMPFANYVAFSIRAYSQHSRWFDCSDFFADNGWNEFKKAVKIRNRITHPKSASDLHISDEDTKTVEAASEWFQSVVHELSRRFKMISEGKKPDLKRAKKEIAEPVVSPDAQNDTPR